jgi:hypothetical protein
LKNFCPSLNRLIEVTFKELKSGWHLGQMQVTKEKERVDRAIRLPVMANFLSLRLYGQELEPDQGFTIFRLKQQVADEVWSEQLDRSDVKWRKKTRSIQGGRLIAKLPPVTFQKQSILIVCLRSACEAG